MDAARDLYQRLLAFAQGRLDQASSPAEVRAALRSVIDHVELGYVGVDLAVAAGLRLDEPEPEPVWLRLVEPEPYTTSTARFDAFPIPPLTVELEPARRTPPTHWAKPSAPSIRSTRMQTT